MENLSITAKGIYLLIQLMKRRMDFGKTEDQANPDIVFDVYYLPFCFRKRLRSEF